MTAVQDTPNKARAEPEMPDYSVAAAFHAALLSRHGTGIAIVGPSLSGKSTLATALWVRGWTLMSDDVAFVDSFGVASPDQRKVSLRHGSRELVGDDTWHRVKNAPSTTETNEGLLFHPRELHEGPPAGSTTLAAFFFLARREVVTAPATTTAINRAGAAVALLPYAMNVRHLPFPVAIRAIAPLAESIPAFDLGRGDLAEMVAAVEKIVSR